jgi:hypothetical protein
MLFVSGETMIRFTMLALCVAGVLATGCDKKEDAAGADGKPAASGAGDTAAAKGDSGVKECDAYFARADECAAKGSAEAKKAILAASKSMRENLGRAGSPEAKKAYATGCRQALEALNATCK